MKPDLTSATLDWQVSPIEKLGMQMIAMADDLDQLGLNPYLADQLREASLKLYIQKV